MSKPQPMNDKDLDARVREAVRAMMSGAAQLPAATDDETLVDAKQVLGPIFGGRSDMWLHRKLKDPGADFPKPITIANRRYWKLGEIRAWIAAQATKGKTRGPTGSTAAAVGLILLICGAPVERQIWAAWTPPVTLVCDPSRDVASEVTATSVFPTCQATAYGADVPKIKPVGRAAPSRPRGRPPKLAEPPVIDSDRSSHADSSTGVA